MSLKAIIEEETIDDYADDYDNHILSTYFREAQRLVKPQEEIEALLKRKTDFQRQLYNAGIEYGITYEEAVDVSEKSKRGNYVLQKTYTTRGLSALIRKIDSLREKMGQDTLEELRHLYEAGLEYDEAKRLLTDMERKEEKEIIFETKYDGRSLKAFVRRHAPIQKEISSLVNQVCEANLKLVVSIAKKNQGRGVDLLDMIQEGNLGLRTGIIRYDYDSGYALSTYATTWITHHITRYIEVNGRTVRLPVHLLASIRKIWSYSKEYYKKHNEYPSYQEIATKFDVPLKKVIKVMSAKQPEVSLNQVIASETNTEFIGFFEDTSENNFHERMHVVNGNILSELQRLKEAKKGITERDYQILLYRYGLDGRDALTLKATGEKLFEDGFAKKTLSRERIRQLEAIIFQKLRKNPTMQALFEGIK